mmetsp:Transcript_801/g.1300  ORF Transcript_801/g.1300 Transcript_801/m.1300 type:complete len:345 (+) Transcript_801:479-1513(+)
MDPSSHFASSMKSRNHATIFGQYISVHIDRNATHTIVQYGSDGTCVKYFRIKVFASSNKASEGNLAELILASRSTSCVAFIRFAQHLHVLAHPVRQGLEALESLEQALVRIQIDMFLTILGCVRCQNQGKRGDRTGLVPLLRFRKLGVVCQHLIAHVGTITELVTESLPLVVDEDTSNPTHQFGSQGLTLVVRVLGVNPTSWMDLNLVHIDSSSTKRPCQRDAVTGRKGTSGRWHVQQLGSVVLKIRSGTAIGGKASRGQKNIRGVQQRLLSILSIYRHTKDTTSVRISNQRRDLGIDQDLDLSCLLIRLDGLLHTVNDFCSSHAIARSMGPLVGVSSKLSQEG